MPRRRIAEDDGAASNGGHDATAWKRGFSSFRHSLPLQRESRNHDLPTGGNGGGGGVNGGSSSTGLSIVNFTDRQYLNILQSIGWAYNLLIEMQEQATSSLAASELSAFQQQNNESRKQKEKRGDQKYAQYSKIIRQPAAIITNQSSSFKSFIYRALASKLHLQSFTYKASVQGIQILPPNNRHFGSYMDSI
ncbi:hypothetical protein ACFX2J_018384 [Malus domestica]